jgi:hypothetical protein
MPIESRLTVNKHSVGPAWRTSANFSRATLVKIARFFDAMRFKVATAYLSRMVGDRLMIVSVFLGRVIAT